MLENIFYSGVIYYVMGGIIIGGVISKVITTLTFGKLLKESSRMGKSVHSFMKLVRAKYEHACMVNDYVENVEVFLEKYLHEYHVLGIPLYGWQRLKQTFAMLLGILVLIHAGITYSVVGWEYLLIQDGENGMASGVSVGVISLLALLCFYQVGNEKYKVNAMKSYMVDYLQNVCAHKYSKTNLPKEKIVIPALEEEVEASSVERIRERVVGKGEEEPLTNVSYSGMPLPEEESRNITMTMVEKLLTEEAERRKEMKNKKQEERLPNEAAIREILQEFMA